MKQKRKFERLYLQKYSELQPKIWHILIILTKVILGIFWAILETDTWELLQKLVELTRNDPFMIWTEAVKTVKSWLVAVQSLPKKVGRV